MRDKSPAPHFKHILSEREEQFHENMAATSSREIAAQRLDYDVRLHHFEPYRKHGFGLSRVYNTKLLLAEVIAVYKELKELVVGAELDFCPHAYTTTASPRPTLNPKRKSTEPSQQIKNVGTFRSRRITPRRHPALRAAI